MKINMIWKPRLWNLIFNPTLGLKFLGILMSFLLPMSSIYAQKITKTFEKEIQVSEDITVIAESPRVMNIEGHGTVNIDNTKDEIIISGKGDLPGLRMDKDFNIKTWDKNVVRMVVEISVLTENQVDAQKLLAALKNPLEETPNKRVEADCNLNMNRFVIKNGFFSDDKFTMILDDGSKFNIKTMELKATLTIPKSGNLTIKCEYNRVNLDDLDGELRLNMKYSALNMGKVKNLKANLNNCSGIRINQVENASINSVNSGIFIKKVKNLDIGDKSTLMEWQVQQNDILTQFGNFNLSGDSDYLDRNLNSMMNIYDIEEVENLIISETANDKFNLGKVGKLQSGLSIFSNYNIKKLMGSIFLTAKSGDLKIDEVSKEFQQIDLNNELSTVILNINDEANYLLNIYRNRFSEYALPPDLEQINSQDNWEKTYLKGDKSNAGEINIRCDRCEISIYD